MTSKFSGDLAVTGNNEADQLLNKNPLALLLGMLLDQQIPMEWAFSWLRDLPRFPEEGIKQISATEPQHLACLLYTSPSPRDGLLSRMPSSA